MRYLSKFVFCVLVLSLSSCATVSESDRSMDRMMTEIAEGDLESADTYAFIAIRQDPDNYLAWVKQVEVQLARGLPHNALTTCKKGRQQFQETGDSCLTYSYSRIRRATTDKILAKTLAVEAKSSLIHGSRVHARYKENAEKRKQRNLAQLEAYTASQLQAAGSGGEFNTIENQTLNNNADSVTNTPFQAAPRIGTCLKVLRDEAWGSHTFLENTCSDELSVRWCFGNQTNGCETNISSSKVNAYDKKTIYYERPKYDDLAFIYYACNSNHMTCFDTLNRYAENLRAVSK